METTEERVEFTPQQQAKVQQLIDDAYRRAFQKALKQAAPEEMEELKNELLQLREEKKKADILRTVSRFNVVDPDEVVELLSKDVELDEKGSPRVRGQDGVALEEYVSLWLSRRPHHLRTTHGGGGSYGAGPKEPSPHYDLSDPAVWRNMPAEDLHRYLKEGVDIHAGGRLYRFRDVANPFVEARRRKFKGR
ncbi:MAG TPA: hypothetical protein ENK42_05450 [Deltaproteobacteria bacterium]|nr:hypothetical protein [Deltaproteobacteria bacterium]